MAFSIKRHDTRPAYIVDLVDNFGLTGQAAINLAAATSITFKMREADSPDSQAPKVSRAMTVVDASSGRVRHNWIVGDTDTTGDFSVEFEILWSDGGVETVPNNAYLVVSVVEDLDAQ